MNIVLTNQEPLNHSTRFKDYELAFSHFACGVCYFYMNMSEGFEKLFIAIRNEAAERNILSYIFSLKMSGLEFENKSYDPVSQNINLLDHAPTL